MERFVLDDLSWEQPYSKIQSQLMLEDEDDIVFMYEKYLEACKIACPKAVYSICETQSIQGDKVTIENYEFQSETLAKKMEGIHRVFPFVVTCGKEIDDWSHQETDSIVSVWLDILKEQILHSARNDFFARIRKQYAIPKISSMHPGAGNLDTWPLSQQRGLFALIGNVTEDIGVTLTDSLLMLPTKSSSGIIFPSEVDFVTCSLCKRKNCVGRHAPYQGDS